MRVDAPVLIAGLILIGGFAAFGCQFVAGVAGLEATEDEKKAGSQQQCQVAGARHDPVLGQQVHGGGSRQHHDNGGHRNDHAGNMSCHAPLRKAT